MVRARARSRADAPCPFPVPEPARHAGRALGVVSVRHAVGRAREAEELAQEQPQGARRAMLEEIARLWRELAQDRMLDDLAGGGG